MACGAQILDQANAGASESRDASRPRAARKAEPNRMALRDFAERPTNQGVVGSNPAGRAKFQGLGSENQVLLGWARDFGPRGITVKVIQPGPIDTEMNPADGAFADLQKAGTALGRYGRPEEIAATVAFLASQGAAFITGASIDVDGGYNA
jgi:enoyl-[acyl-carrier-protein] reductase (NADH)